MAEGAFVVRGGDGAFRLRRLVMAEIKEAPAAGFGEALAVLHHHVDAGEAVGEVAPTQGLVARAVLVISLFQ